MRVRRLDESERQNEMLESYGGWGRKKSFSYEQQKATEEQGARISCMKRISGV